jgi:carboxymethylenebutenolidase
MSEGTRVEDVELGRFHRPEGGASFPGIVLIHDVWGLSPHSRALAADLAAEGYGVLELDLYRDREGPPSEDPGAFIRALPDREILALVDRGADWLAAQPCCHGRKLGVIGVCMGGTYALLVATHSDRFAAAAPFYGILSYDTGMLQSPSGRDPERKPVSPIEAAERLRMPLHAFFGSDDAFVPEADVAALESGLAKSGQRFTIDRFAGAGHAFLNKTREAAFRADASAKAWSLLVPFLAAELGLDEHRPSRR